MFEPWPCFSDGRAVAHYSRFTQDSPRIHPGFTQDSPRIPSSRWPWHLKGRNQKADAYIFTVADVAHAVAGGQDRSDVRH